MSRHDIIALFLCLVIFLAGIFVGLKIYEGIPHVEDEIAFVWQARVIERGQLWIPSPQPNPDSFKVPFVVDYNGRRFGKYPPGWPALLAAGEFLNLRFLVNPFLTAAGFWFLYRLITRITGSSTALLALGLGCLSPFVWMNSGSLLSHPWSLFLTIAFLSGWLDGFGQANPALPEKYSRILPITAGSLALGMLALTRPWSAVAVALPALFHAVYLLFRGRKRDLAHLGLFILITGSTAFLYLLWQLAVTGSLFLNPYTLWWPYDRVGFGPGIGRYPNGYQPADGLANTLFSLFAGNSDLFGWPVLSWLLLPWGVIALRRNIQAWLVIALLPALVGAYALYWTPSWIYGPRYYYEAVPAVLLLSAAGLHWLAGVPSHPGIGKERRSFNRLRYILVMLVPGVLMGLNLALYLPARLAGLSGLYGINSKCSAPAQAFASSQSRPILVFIELQKDFTEYSCTLDDTSPFFDSHLVTAVSRGKRIDRLVASEFPDRAAYYYRPGTQTISGLGQDDPSIDLDIR